LTTAAEEAKKKPKLKPQEEKGDESGEKEPEDMPDDVVAMDPDQPETLPQEDNNEDTTEPETGDTTPPDENEEIDSDADDDSVGEEGDGESGDTDDNSGECESEDTNDSADTTDTSDDEEGAENKDEDVDGKSDDNDGEDDKDSTGPEGDAPDDEEQSRVTPLTAAEIEAADKAIEAQEDFLNGDVEKEGITSEQEADVELMEEADVEVREVKVPNHKFKVVVIKHLTKGILMSPIFPFKSIDYASRGVLPVHHKEVQAGLVLGKQLGNKLRIINEETTTTTIRRPAGKIVKRLLHELKSGETNIFSTTETHMYDTSVVHITIDGSGSMKGGAFAKSIKMAVAIAKAASMTDMIDVVISLRGNADYNPLVAIVYDSTVDTIKHLADLAQYFSPECGTPEGLCYEAILSEIQLYAKGRNAYFVNLSDGMPCFYQITEAEGVEITKIAVDKIRKSGVEVLSYFIISDDGMSDAKTASKQFKYMYGRDAVTINVESLTSIAKTLNAKFMNKQLTTV
jgi:hypothetical protein